MNQNYKCVVCSIIKDEQKFLKEWIDWNLHLGFSYIYLYEDIGSRSHKSIVSSYDNVFLYNILDIIEDNENINRQFALYNKFISIYKNTYDWCAFIDVDEFIQFDKDYNLLKICGEFNDNVGIELWWKWYGSNGHIISPNINVQEAYHDDYCKHLENYTKFEYKTFLNLHKASRMINVHRHHSIVNTDHIMDCYKYPIRCYSKMWIDHYRIKSLEDYKQSLVRGNISKNLRTMDLYEKSLFK